MSNEKHIKEFDELIREMASGAETPVPPSVWEGVSSGTSAGAAGTGAAGIAGKAIIAKWAAIIAGAALVVTATVVLLRDDASDVVTDPVDKTVTQIEDRTIAPQDESGTSETVVTDQVDTDSGNNTQADVSQRTDEQSATSESVPESSGVSEETATNNTTATNDEIEGDHKDVDEPVNGNEELMSPQLEVQGVLCAGEATTAELNGSAIDASGVQWWLDGKLVTVGGMSQSLYLDKTGKHQLKLRFSQDGRLQEIDRVIDVQRTSAAIVSESEKGKLILRAQGDVRTGRWFINNVEVEAIDGVVEYQCENYSDHDVVLIAANDNGCRDTIEETVQCTWEDKIDVDAPNIFSPYIKDGKNDFFEIRMDLVKTYHMQITDTRGKLVFETTDQSNFWNGQMMNEGDMLPEGWYNYVLKYSNGGKEETLYGRLILVK